MEEVSSEFARLYKALSLVEWKLWLLHTPVLARLIREQNSSGRYIYSLGGICG